MQKKLCSKFVNASGWEEEWKKWYWVEKVRWEGANRTMEGVGEWKLSCRGENEREGLKG